MFHTDNSVAFALEAPIAQSLSATLSLFAILGKAQFRIGNGQVTDKHHDGIESVVFSCTGTEANEVALMMARGATGGQGIICTDAAYHGNSTEVRRLSHCKADTDNVRSIPFPETFRFGQITAPTADPRDYFLGKLAEVIAGFERDGIALAGMLVCPIFANEGLPNVPAGFLSKARELVHAAGCR